MTHNGKISRLPKDIIEQLNRRLEDDETGKDLVAWLNSLPQVQAIIQSEFEGRPIREQNLSEWKKRGFRHWQRRQERRELFSQLQTTTADMRTATDSRSFHRQTSVMLATDLALAAREVLDEVQDPEKRAEALGQLIGKFTQLRREESNAIRAQVARERWKLELAEAEEERRPDQSTPEHALFLQRLYIDTCSRQGIDQHSQFRTPHSAFNDSSPSKIQAQSE